MGSGSGAEIYKQEENLFVIQKEFSGEFCIKEQ